MDHMTRLSHFRSEAAAFDQAVRRALEPGGETPLVPSCPGWSVSDLVGHLGSVHRYVGHILRERLTGAPDATDLSLYGLPADPRVRAAWPAPDRAPNRGPVPEELTEWFARGAGELAALFRELGPEAPVWTWAPEQTSGFWLRMQTIELALHRWDAASVTGEAGPLAPALAADAVAQTFEVMAPARRSWRVTPPGTGERYRFRRTDGPQSWTVAFAGDEVLTDPDPTAPVDVEAAGTASDLALFLWHRLPPTALRVSGDTGLLPHYFMLVPPV
ncbi:maleylpyruvate isomerase family mycothiol-dependent enzyme [Streptomyces sp. NBC_01408]|uniref:maleylpyruvate isomerase N-terminal domain-containing protein n=1 Tax=Streptomyces sp. NBC_01408 TaxID=2903855 RepID=UPI0022590C73|nr:maleylpyruvate isomerase family mycothiol-dependent enzyme [Streptomyces sp. NBC_01408]MCX4695016.1 maleylpyruvate isomerase family mycothiol-dependent enzyme [Streptomyces sp. NBC_01408]